VHDGRRKEVLPVNEDRHSDYNPRLMGALIRDARADAHMSQEEASERAGIARTHLAMIEHGKKKATVDTLWKISSALNIRLSTLFQKLESIMDKLPDEDTDKAIDDAIQKIQHDRREMERKRNWFSR
jgi:transcriptional regulator with XRE-family HTH domain